MSIEIKKIPLNILQKLVIAPHFFLESSNVTKAGKNEIKFFQSKLLRHQDNNNNTSKGNRDSFLSPNGSSKILVQNNSEPFVNNRRSLSVLKTTEENLKTPEPKKSDSSKAKNQGFVFGKTEDLFSPEGKTNQSSPHIKVFTKPEGEKRRSFSIEEIKNRNFTIPKCDGANSVTPGKIFNQNLMTSGVKDYWLSPRSPKPKVKIILLTFNN